MYRKSIKQNIWICLILSEQYTCGYDWKYLMKRKRERKRDRLIVKAIYIFITEKRTEWKGNNEKKNIKY